jgi:hypothetical protein
MFHISKDSRKIKKSQKKSSTKYLQGTKRKRVKDRIPDWQTTLFKNGRCRTIRLIILTRYLNLTFSFSNHNQYSLSTSHLQPIHSPPPAAAQQGWGWGGS